MAPVVSSGAFRSLAGATSVTVTADEASPAEGCLRLVFISCAAGRDIATTAAGWQRLYGSTSIGSGSFGVFVRTFTAGDGPAVFNFAGTSATTTGAAHVLTVNGHNPAKAPTTQAGGGSSATVTAPTVTASVDSLLITFHAVTGNPATLTTPSGMTRLGASAHASGAGHSAASFSEPITDAVNTGVRSSTSSVSGNWRAASVVVTRANANAGWWTMLLR